jgi:hypothetical protein
VTTVRLDRLYQRLPAVVRRRDEDQGRPLQALLRAAAEQGAVVEQSLDRYLDDLFIETCDDWVIAYLGDLVGTPPLLGGAAQARVDVAKTISYRRRKGTVPMLEELARDVTGWGAHAVEMFELLGWHQHLDHLRPQAGWFDIRRPERADRVDGAFDVASRTFDAAPPGDGVHAISTIAFFLWRLRSYPVQGVVLRTPGGTPVHVRPPATPAAGGPNRFHVSTLGAPVRLFSRWVPEGDPAGLTQERHVPAPIRPLAFSADLARLAEEPDAALAFYGPGQLAGVADDCFPGVVTPTSGGSLAVFVDDVVVPADRILCKDLSTWEVPPPGSDRVAVDVVRGRVAFAPDAAPGEVTVEHHVGFPGDVGAGPYDRRRRGPQDHLAGFGLDTVEDPLALESSLLTVSPVGDHTSVVAALAEWSLAPGMLPALVIEVGDDGVYPGDLVIDAGRVDRLVVQAANGRRPTVLGDVRVTGDGPDASIALDGLLVAGRVIVEGSLSRLRVSHCTLVPGGALDEDGEPVDRTAVSLEATAALGTELLVETSITGAVVVSPDAQHLHVYRSIVDGLDRHAIDGPGGEPGPPTTLDQVTALGAVDARVLELVSASIVTGALSAQRRQQGCVRYSWVAPGSVTPRRHRCQPDLALAGLTGAAAQDVVDRLVPVLTSSRYGDADYTQLAGSCPLEITTGAQDGTEMGVWHHLRTPHREADLRRRLREYLPYGLDPALVTVT